MSKANAIVLDGCSVKCNILKNSCVGDRVIVVM
uniref:Uncharacterized protein n=1 Tax=Rhizophora mucronata TaxID=61149 RepID=A0A2P2Q5G9_RHIMU